MITVIIPFVRVQRFENPNQSSATDDDAERTYLEAALVSFSSFRRWNPTVALEFVTNSEPPDWFQQRLLGLEAQLRLLNFEHDPPPGYAKAFRGAFFLLDALESPPRSEMAVYVDPDVVCLQSIEEFEDLYADAIGVLEIDYAIDRRVNGLSSRDAGVVHRELGEDRATPTHFGGEMYVIPKPLSEDLIARLRRSWNYSLRAFEAGKPYFTTEEHLLNFAIAGVPHSRLNDWARRVWTAHSYRNVLGDENQLAVWHLPAEKDRGFRALRGPVANRSSWFWIAAPQEYRHRMSKTFGISGRSAVRRTIDALAAARRRMRDRRAR